MPRPSRRAVLATGPALGGAVLVGGLPAQATAAAPRARERAAPDPWRTVLDDADMVWQRMPRTWYEGPFLGNGFLGSGIYAEPGRETAAVRFNVQHSEVQDHRPEFGSLFGLARLPIGHFPSLFQIWSARNALGSISCGNSCTISSSRWLPITLSPCVCPRPVTTMPGNPEVSQPDDWAPPGPCSASRDSHR